MSAPTEPRVNVDEVNGFVVVPPKDEINLTKIRTSKVADDDHLTQAQGTQITNGLDSGTFRKKSSKQKSRDESILLRLSLELDYRLALMALKVFYEISSFTFMITCIGLVFFSFYFMKPLWAFSFGFLKGWWSSYGLGPWKR